MKNNYRKLKLSILFQTVFVTALTLLVGGVLLKYVLEGSSNDLVDILTSIHISEEDAIQWYWKVLGNNKELILILGFLILFSIFFYVSLGQMVKYFRQVEAGIDNIASEKEESIEMITELKPIEKKLSEIKYTLKRREREAQEAEKKKNDLVVFLAHDLKTPLTSVPHQSWRRSCKRSSCPLDNILCF